MKCLKVLPSSDHNVWKYVFEFDRNAIAEAVLYRYESFQKRTVLCISIQSGCPIGCTFCGTGEDFIRNLTAYEIVNQVSYTLDSRAIDADKCEKLQIMFMSMGEPFLNYDNVDSAIRILNVLYPDADLLISTIAPRSKYYGEFISLSKKVSNLGLQFSVHKSTDEERDKLIPFKGKLTLSQIMDYGELWSNETGRKPYLNYCVNGENSHEEDFDRLAKLFAPDIFNMTFSVICTPDENMKERAFRDLDHIEKFRMMFVDAGYNTRVFDPAGQDDIGGGCGQLWFVQKYIADRKKEGVL